MLLKINLITLQKIKWFIILKEEKFKKIYFLKMEIIEIENSKYVYARNIFGKYYIPYDLIHRPCPQIILKGGVWEYDTLKFIESEYKGGDIIHAGTFFGDFLPFLSKISKNYNVYAFEPVLENYKCSKFELMKNEQDHFEVLRKMQQVPELSQRELAQELGFSLGKLNYCLKALKKKGLIKIRNFRKNENRFNPVSKYNYFYIL